MSDNWQREPKIEDCPNCGAKEGAFMGSSEWGHCISCCSDKCGMAIREIIAENESKKSYNDKLEKYYELQDELLSERLDGINCDCDPLYKL